MEQRFSDLIILLSSGINQRRMYFDDHPKVQTISRDFVDQLQDLVASNPGGVFTFGVYQGKFVRRGQFLVGPSIAGRSLIAFAENLGCGGFTFCQPLEPTDLISFFRLAAITKEPVGDLETARCLFARMGLGNIQLADPFTEGEGGHLHEGADQPGTHAAAPSDDLSRADFTPLVDVYQALYEIVSLSSAQALRGGALDIPATQTCGEKLAMAAGNGIMDVMQFIRYPDFDSYTIGHSVRVAALAVVIGQHLGLPENIITELATASLLHDIGKSEIPTEILFKPGKLDVQERIIIESHPVRGAQILLANGEASEIMITAAWGHHLRQDGCGYPKMPSWHQIGFAAAIIHVCDVFEALTAARPYKKPMTPQRAYEVMFQDSTAYDPRALSALVQTLGLYPPGSALVLTDGRRGVVALRGNDLDNPGIRITHDQLGRPISDPSPELLYLARDRQPGVVNIVLVGAGDN